MQNTPFSIKNSVYEFRHSFDLGVASRMQPKNHRSLGERTFLSWFQLSLPCSSFNFLHSASGEAAEHTEQNTAPSHQAIKIL